MGFSREKLTKIGLFHSRREMIGDLILAVQKEWISTRVELEAAPLHKMLKTILNGGFAEYYTNKSGLSKHQAELRYQTMKILAKVGSLLSTEVTQQWKDAHLEPNF